MLLAHPGEQVSLLLHPAQEHQKDDSEEDTLTESCSGLTDLPLPLEPAPEPIVKLSPPVKVHLTRPPSNIECEEQECMIPENTTQIIPEYDPNESSDDCDDSDDDDVHSVVISDIDDSDAVFADGPAFITHNKSKPMGLSSADEMSPRYPKKSSLKVQEWCDLQGIPELSDHLASEGFRDPSELRFCKDAELEEMMSKWGLNSGDKCRLRRAVMSKHFSKMKDHNHCAYYHSSVYHSGGIRGGGAGILESKEGGRGSDLAYSLTSQKRNYIKQVSNIFGSSTAIWIDRLDQIHGSFVLMCSLSTQFEWQSEDGWKECVIVASDLYNVAKEIWDVRPKTYFGNSFLPIKIQPHHCVKAGRIDCQFGDINSAQGICDAKIKQCYDNGILVDCRVAPPRLPKKDFEPIIDAKLKKNQLRKLHLFLQHLINSPLLVFDKDDWFWKSLFRQSSKPISLELKSQIKETANEILKRLDKFVFKDKNLKALSHDQMIERFNQLTDRDYHHDYHHHSSASDSGSGITNEGYHRKQSASASAARRDSREEIKEDCIESAKMGASTMKSIRRLSHCISRRFPNYIVFSGVYIMTYPTKAFAAVNHWNLLFVSEPVKVKDNPEYIHLLRIGYFDENRMSETLVKCVTSEALRDRNIHWVTRKSAVKSIGECNVLWCHKDDQSNVDFMRRCSVIYYCDLSKQGLLFKPSEDWDRHPDWKRRHAKKKENSYFFGYSKVIETDSDECSMIYGKEHFEEYPCLNFRKYGVTYPGIIKLATNWLAQGDYNPVTRNCQHWCAYALRHLFSDPSVLRLPAFDLGRAAHMPIFGPFHG